MLDVHVIISRETHPHWVRQCLSSIHIAMALAPFPVMLRTFCGHPGHIGLGRAEGYGAGNFPWVTCIDDDDLVLPEAFANLSRGLESDKYAVSTLEIEMRNNAFRIGGKRHHLNVYRRDQIIDHTPWECCGDVAQIKAIPDDEWFDGTSPGYLWRVYEGSKARALRLSHPAELSAANG
jgi:hypothetical protein